MPARTIAGLPLKVRMSDCPDMMASVAADIFAMAKGDGVSAA